MLTGEKNRLAYETKDFRHLFNKLSSLSEKQLITHYGLYEGYVKKIKELQERQNIVDRSNTTPTYSDFREIKVEESFAHNGVVLHELYFSNLSEHETTPTMEFRNQIEENFGSWEKYIDDLMLTAKSARGWALTGFNFIDCKLWNYCLDSHNMLVPIAVRPIMVIDVYEHAYLIDYNTNRTAYLDAIKKNLDWETASKRFECSARTAKQY